MIRVVLLDLMGTLVHDPYREALAAGIGAPLASLGERAVAFRRWPAFERGELDEPGYWASVRDGGVPFDAEAFHEVRRAGTVPLPGVPALLDDLGGVVRRVVASNYPRWIDDVVPRVLGDRVDDVVASCDLGARKPDEAFYVGALRRADVAPGEALFVDDRPENVAAAEALGVAAHLFVDASELRAWLVARGVEVPAG